MDLEIIILSDLGQREKDKHHMISLICGIKKKKKKIQKRYKGTYLQNRNKLTDLKTNLWLPQEKSWRGGIGKMGIA